MKDTYPLYSKVLNQILSCAEFNMSVCVKHSLKGKKNPSY